MSDMPSIPAYIDSLDIERLERLIDVATKRIKAKREAQWVQYWEVADDMLCFGRYAWNDWASAQARAIWVLQNASPNLPIELTIEPRRCPPDEIGQVIVGDI